MKQLHPEIDTAMIDGYFRECPWLTDAQRDDLIDLANGMLDERMNVALARLTARSVRFAVENEQAQRESVYRDTEQRYHTDAEFCAAVQMLEHAAETHGFTPGELKQIAFKAALNIEMRTARPVPFRSKR